MGPGQAAAREGEGLMDTHTIWWLGGMILFAM
jgi:hypothetical protein